MSSEVYHGSLPLQGRPPRLYVPEPQEISQKIVDGDQLTYYSPQIADICLNSGDFIETETELIVKGASVMHAGVYNGKRKTGEELAESVRWWQGIPVTIQSDQSIADHTPTGIVTAKTVVVGQVLNPSWDEQNLRINADLHFIKDETPLWLADDLRARKTHGVSGAYFCDFLEGSGEENGKTYDSTELNYRPNNLAIVERPACKPPECGIFMNSNITNPNYATVTGTYTGDGTYSPYGTGDGTIENPFTFIKINSEDKTMPEDLKDDLIKIAVEKTKIELNSEHKTAMDAKNRELADKVTEIAQLNAELTKTKDELKTAKETIAEVEKNSQKLKFLSQFPEVNREAAEKDLWPVYLENPGELVMNSAKIAELMKTAEDAPVSQGKEFVKNADEDSDLPTADSIKAQMGL